jgi:hypothetical protein
VRARRSTGWMERLLLVSSLPTPAAGMASMESTEPICFEYSPEPSRRPRYARRCIGFEQSAHAAQLKFATGETETVDVAIGADGIQSSLQKHVIEPSTPEYSGSRAYRGLIPRERFRNGQKRRMRSGWEMGSTSWFIQSGAVDFSTRSASFRQRAKPLNHGRQSVIAMSSPRLSTVGIHASSGSLRK